jgi:hypothetical protein
MAKAKSLNGRAYNRLLTVLLFGIFCVGVTYAVWIGQQLLASAAAAAARGWDAFLL